MYLLEKGLFIYLCYTLLHKLSHRILLSPPLHVICLHFFFGRLLRLVHAVIGPLSLVHGQQLASLHLLPLFFFQSLFKLVLIQLLLYVPFLGLILLLFLLVLLLLAPPGLGVFF